MNILHLMILTFIILLPYHLDSLYYLQEPQETMMIGGECADKAYLYYSIMNNVSFCVGTVIGNNISGMHSWCQDTSGIVECAGFDIMDATYTPLFILYQDGSYIGTYDRFI